MRKIKIKKSAKAQDEMVGFALIIIIVAVIFIVFVSIYLNKPKEKTVDYQANSFVQSMLQYTTICEDENLENLTVQDLMAKCKEGNPCYYNEELRAGCRPGSPCPYESNPCIILNNTINWLINTSWKTGTTSPVQGYSFRMNVSENGRTEEQFLNVEKGVVTKNYRSGEQDLPPHRGSWEYAVILFDVYS